MSIDHEVNMRYVKHPYFCPFCNEGEAYSGVNLEAGSPENLGDDMIIQPVTCSSCNAEWNDIFELTSYEKVVRN